jgi:starch synthase (maltosyl-transferring)
MIIAPKTHLTLSTAVFSACFFQKYAPKFSKSKPGQSPATSLIQSSTALMVSPSPHLPPLAFSAIDIYFPGRHLESPPKPMRLHSSPTPGELLLRYVGDRLTFRLIPERRTPEAFVRTNLGRGAILHAEVLQDYYRELRKWDRSSDPIPSTQPRGTAWRDIPMQWKGDAWELELTLTESGFFHAKAYLVDENSRQIWPDGPNTGITVHPSEYRTANTIYCAFTRMFGESKTAVSTIKKSDPLVENLDKQQYTVIPPSGKFRDLIKEFPHVFGTLGCRILHLLPVNPAPTTYARFGRYGSPYAAEDLTAIDPALVEFDRRTTGVEQFQELTHAAHSLGGRVFLDMVINHTGWGSTLQENHPEWFLRKENGVFISPGAWGTIWEDLVELDHRFPLSWEHIADAFITWCRRGVDGFRCDAGYKVPTAAWRYIIARVRHEFPDTLFLLEGLGGAWEATEELLTLGGMQWAYSELFQNYSPIQVSGYLDHSIVKSATVGTLVHYSETHDNERLAAKGRAWSLLRNSLCALASHSGGFGYTCGVEWLAPEKVNVHSSRGLAWGNADNIVAELSRLSALLADHPAFFDNASLRRISGPESPVFVLERKSHDGKDKVLVLVNLDPAAKNSFFLPKQAFTDLGEPKHDLLANTGFKPQSRGENIEFRLEPGQSLCLSSAPKPVGLAGNAYRDRRAQHAFAIRALASVLEPEQIGPHSWTDLAAIVERDPKRFLASLASLDRNTASTDLLKALEAAMQPDLYPAVVEWRWSDRPRITPVPPNHWLLIIDDVPFRATLSFEKAQQHAESISINRQHIATFAPVDLFRLRREGDATLSVERFNATPRQITRDLLFLSDRPSFSPQLELPLNPALTGIDAPAVLLTNGRGGMARICVDLGTVKSKYDAVLAANLHPRIPVDRHIFAKRLRLWANADRFITPLNAANLQSFNAGPPARWEFATIAGDGQVARIEVIADMLHEKNTTVFSLRLLDTSKPGTTVRITARVDLEDRNFHSQTEHNGGADFHFNSNAHALPNRAGFEFRPSGDRRVRVSADKGAYHPSPEWSHHLPHPVEQTRGQVGAGDAFSPGWFDLPLEREVPVYLVIDAETSDSDPKQISVFAAAKSCDLADSFGKQLALATRAFVVRRDEFKTVIAGYPWFLDWGRDSLICARGMLTAGMIEEVRQLLIVFGLFESNGTLPNTIHGEDASNRDTSDAPLWYGIVCEELAAIAGPEIYATAVDAKGRTIQDVLRSIALGYAKGTPNGIVMDRRSALIWSPSHFTWMDTNYPAGTPRQGYPIEIQALWIRLLDQLERIGAPPGDSPWNALATQARESLEKLFWLEEKGWYADTLIAEKNTDANHADPDDALRSNCVIPIMLGLLRGPNARRCMENVLRYLFIPGALRSLAPLPVRRPLPIYGPDWRLLNDPHNPYWGRYEGDEDTQRKPAYHNGTAWTWTFPGACEAIARAWDFSPQAREAARTYLGSMESLLATGCIGHLSEVLDADAPHTQRGCDSQAWSVTEALRVWKLLNK